jgi:plasmid stabilization system protein ParE
LPVAYSVIFTQAAREELIEAQDWYEGEATGLGRRFRQAINALIGRMSDNPRQFPTVFRNVRRALLRRFPYSLFFVVEDDVLIVTACFHGSRDPSHWQERA